MDNRDYVQRVTSADPTQLIIITYELVQKSMDEACSAISVGLPSYAHVEKAHQFLMELMTSLDMTYDIAKQLMSIYIYINKLLITAQIKINGTNPVQAAPLLKEAADIMTLLLNSWHEVAKQNVLVADDQAIDNSPQVFAGLTYKGGKLMEYIEEDKSRGYKA